MAPTDLNGGRPRLFGRLGPGQKAGMFIGGGTLGVLLLCCGGATILGTLVDDPKQVQSAVSATEADPSRTVPAIAAAAPEPSAVLSTELASPTPSPTDSIAVTPTPTPTLATTPSLSPSSLTPATLPPKTGAAPKPKPTTAAPTPKKVNLCGAPGNPYGYNFCGGSNITNPKSDVCSYFSCIDSFWKGKGYMMQCGDGMVSMSGGRQGSCSHHGGNRRAVYQ